MKRVNTYESAGDSDDEFIEYVFTLQIIFRKRRVKKKQPVQCNSLFWVLLEYENGVRLLDVEQEEKYISVN